MTRIQFVIPIMLDEVSVKLGPWKGYHVLAYHTSWFYSNYYQSISM